MIVKFLQRRDTQNIGITKTDNYIIYSSHD